ncbi:MAG: DUF4157 domain-containing protein [Polyangiaceae bacterium]|nr:DUF4157 domain-containing protein [Polyangiaceae bacterium]
MRAPLTRLPLLRSPQTAQSPLPTFQTAALPSQIAIQRMEDVANAAPSQKTLQKYTRALEGSAPVQAVQRAANLANGAPNGLPGPLRAGVEQLSGLSMSDVRVHYNSPEPAQMSAHAFTRGSTIHVAPGQENHLAHEAWHVVQQKQGRVGATTQLMRNGETGGSSEDESTEYDEESDYSQEDYTQNDNEYDVDYPDFDEPDNDEDYNYDDVDVYAEEYMDKYTSGRSKKKNKKDRPPNRPKIYDRYKNRQSSHKQQWLTQTLQSAPTEPDTPVNDNPPPVESVEDEPLGGYGPEVWRGYKDSGQRDRVGSGSYLIPSETGERTGIVGFPQDVSKNILDNVFRGEPPFRPELGNHGKVTWATVTHHGNDPLPSRAYSGRDDPQNALTQVTYQMEPGDKHIPEKTVSRVYEHFSSKATRHVKRINKGQITSDQHRQVVRQAGVRTFKTLGGHGEKGPGVTTMTIPSGPLSRTSGEFVVMPEKARDRITIQGQEKYAKPHGRRPTHVLQDQSDMSDFIHSMDSGAYEEVNNRPDEEQSTPRRRKTKHKRGSTFNPSHRRDNRGKGRKGKGGKRKQKGRLIQRVVQRKLALAPVEPTWQGTPLNDSPQLEHEADVMGRQAQSLGGKLIQRAAESTPHYERPAHLTIQRLPIQRKIVYTNDNLEEITLDVTSSVRDISRLIQYFDRNYPDLPDPDMLRTLLPAYVADPRAYSLDGLVKEYTVKGARLPHPTEGLEKRPREKEERGQLLTGDSEKALSQWLVEPTRFKQKSGSEKQRDLLTYLSADLEENKGLENGENPLTMGALIASFQYLGHNASSLPHSSTGKVQGPESRHPLFYFRSQSQTGMAHEAFNDKILKILGKNINQNPGTFERIPDNLSLLDKAGLKLNAGGPVRAAFGARVNNVSVYASALHQAFETNPKAIKTILEQHYQLGGKPQKELANPKLVQSELLKLTKTETPLPKGNKSIGLDVLNSKRAGAQYIAEHATGYENLTVYNIEGNPNLHVLLNGADQLKQHEALVNTVLSFLEVY